MGPQHRRVSALLLSSNSTCSSPVLEYTASSVLERPQLDEAYTKCTQDRRYNESLQGAR